jgi:hypothetical protein
MIRDGAILEDKAMRLTTLFLGGVMICAVADIAIAQSCIRDNYGRVICGESVSPYGQYGHPRRYYDDGDDYGGYRGYGGGYYRPYANPYGRPGDYGPQTNWNRDCYNVGGQRICCPKNWTVQGGACKPYRGY